MAEPVPAAWRSEVIRILRTQDRKRIEWTITARQDWEFYGFEYEAYDAMIVALSDPNLAGNEVGMMGARESYEFLFHHKGMLMYTKIGLKEGNMRIKIISAHKAKRPTL